MSEYLKTMIKKQKMHTLVPTSGPSCPSDKFVVLSIILQAGEQAEVLASQHIGTNFAPRSSDKESH